VLREDLESVTLSRSNAADGAARRITTLATRDCWLKTAARKDQGATTSLSANANTLSSSVVFSIPATLVAEMDERSKFIDE
jgi:hypothetical protein